MRCQIDKKPTLIVTYKGLESYFNIRGNSSHISSKSCIETVITVQSPKLIGGSITFLNINLVLSGGSVLTMKLGSQPILRWAKSIPLRMNYSKSSAINLISLLVRIIANTYKKGAIYDTANHCRLFLFLPSLDPGGLPKRLPWALTRAKPALVLSLLR